MLRVGIICCPVGVPMANHAITHTFMGALYTNGVGITLSVHPTGFLRPQLRTGRSQIPRFSFVVESMANSIRFGYSAGDKQID